MREEWRDVSGYEGEYAVSNMGRVKSFKIGKGGLDGGCLAQCKTPKGYHVVRLYLDGFARQWRVHQLVARAFMGMPKEGQFIDHLNRDPSDNRVGNLRWAYPWENNENRVLPRGKNHWTQRARSVA